MIGRTKDKKYILLALTIIIILFLIYILAINIFGISLFYMVGKKENQQNKIAVKYKNNEFRYNYFYQNKKYFDSLVNILNENDSIYEITYNEFCKDYSYENKNVSICSKNEIDEFLIKQITKSFKELELNSILLDNDTIIFRKVNTPEYRVWFNYCRNKDKCSNKNEFFEESYGIFEENIINENWSSYYSNISTM